MTTSRIIDAVRVRDQLGKPDTQALFGPFRRSEKVRIRELPEAIIKYDESIIARWDDADTTWDGTDFDDQWVDYSNTNVRSIEMVNNINNEFYWKFYFNNTLGADNKDVTIGFIGSNNTCTINTIDGQAEFTSGQILEIVSAFKDSTYTVSSATLNITIDSGSFDLEMSADGGSNWETVTNSVAHTFLNTGSELRLRITENNTSTGVISLIKCNYIK